MSLLEMSLSGAVMILAVLVIRCLGRRALPGRTFPVLWELVLLRLLVPITLRSPVSVYGAAPLPAVPLSGELPNAPAAVLEAPPQAAPASVPFWALAWGLGTALWAGYFALVYLRCRREFRTALPVESRRAEVWLEEHPLRLRRISLRQSDRISGPLTYGVVRPVILLPSSLDWEDSLAHILTHETVHIRRFDALVKLLLAAAFALHWWNPAVWLLYRLAGQDLELACDEETVRLLERELGPSSRRDYARTLLRMEERRGLSLFNSFSRPVLERRIREIMKRKKRTLPALLAAVLLVTGVAAAFGTSAKEPALTGALTGEEYEKLSALRLEGYERMTVAQFQNRIWELTDTPEYPALLDRLGSDEVLYARRDSRELEGFWYYVLCPLINDQWQSRQFDGAVQKDFGDGRSAQIEYTLTLTILDRDSLTVGTYSKAREEIARSLQVFLDRRTGPEGLGGAATAECRRLVSAWNSEALRVRLEYALNDRETTPDPVQDPAKTAPDPVPPEDREPREYPHGTEEDYRSLLVLRTPGYQTLSLREFNQRLLDWADADYERMERVNIDIGTNDFQVELTEEELDFLRWSVRLSGAENGQKVRSLYTGRPEEPCLIVGIQLEKSDGHGAWCTLWYQFSYRVPDPDALTVEVRDRQISGFVEAVRRFFWETELSRLTEMTEEDAAKRLEALAEAGSSELLSISVSRDQVQLEHQEEWPSN